MLSYLIGVITGIVVLNLVERYFGERDAMTIPQDLSLLPADMGGTSSHDLAWQTHCDLEQQIFAMQHAWEERNMLAPQSTGGAIPLADIPTRSMKESNSLSFSPVALSLWPTSLPGSMVNASDIETN